MQIHVPKAISLIDITLKYQFKEDGIFIISNVMNNKHVGEQSSILRNLELQSVFRVRNILPLHCRCKCHGCSEDSVLSRMCVINWSHVCGIVMHWCSVLLEHNNNPWFDSPTGLGQPIVCWPHVIRYNHLASLV